jgi:outer membrane lipoprotein SlyB
MKLFNGIHPLAAIAAICLSLLCLFGIAGLTGILPLHKEPTPIVAMAPTQAPIAVPMAQKPIQSNYVEHRQAAPSVHHFPRHEYAQPQVYNSCFNCGVIENVVPVYSQHEGSGIGGGLGAVAGGLLGHQVGGGNGRTLATIAGVVGGAYAGNEIEKRSQSATSYVAKVRMDNGEVRSFPSNGFSPGSHVHIVNGAITQ